MVLGPDPCCPGSATGRSPRLVGGQRTQPSPDHLPPSRPRTKRFLLSARLSRVPQVRSLQHLAAPYERTIYWKSLSRFVQGTRCTHR